MTRRDKSLVCLIGIAALLSVGACGDDDDVSQSDYVAANEEIFEGLPAFPDAELVDTTTSPFFEGDGADTPVAGYTTNVVFRVPDGISADDVVSFYEGELADEWEFEREESPVIDLPSGDEIGIVVTATFSRNSATVSVNTDGITTGDSTFEIGIDSGG